MQNKKTIIFAVLLIISGVNFTMLSGNENLRPIQFVSIFVIGALSALLLNELFTLLKVKQ
jgi:hypothetical protein